MTDKELLEKAANAAGLHIGFINEQPRVLVDVGYTPWNPFTDDGDALRLAVNLCFSIVQYQYSVEVMIGDELIHRELSGGTVTRLELTRRAITRAAAAMAKE